MNDRAPTGERSWWGRTWLLLFAAFTVFLALQLNLAGTLRFAVDSASTTGTVTALAPLLHNTFQVEYSVGGVRFTMDSNYDGGAATHTIGDRVTVFYTRNDPAFSSLEPPGRALGGATFYLALFAVLGATWFTLIFEWWRRTRPRRRGA